MWDNLKFILGLCLITVPIWSDGLRSVLREMGWGRYRMEVSYRCSECGRAERRRSGDAHPDGV